MPKSNGLCYTIFMKGYKKWLWPLCFFALGIVLGIALKSLYPGDTATSTNFRSIRLDDPEHSLISPLLLSGISVQGDTQEFKNIESTLKLLTYDALNVAGMDTISIYYKDLNSGLWAGISENTGYDPASLLKVPIMIAWLKKAEKDPSTLSQRFIWGGSPNDGKNIEFFGLTPGQSYSVDELIRLMIAKSDNDAKNLLFSKLDSKTLNTVFSDLGITNWDDKNGNPNKISPIAYSRFLRVLYNATYLNRDFSQKALELLSSSDYNNGIMAGIPSGIQVAHKFGQYTYDDTRGLIPHVELHDCGIVYYPKKPYLLCVMTDGRTDLSNLESIIGKISLAVYDAVNKGN